MLVAAHHAITQFSHVLRLCFGSATQIVTQNPDWAVRAAAAALSGPIVCIAAAIILDAINRKGLLERPMSLLVDAAFFPVTIAAQVIDFMFPVGPQDR